MWEKIKDYLKERPWLTGILLAIPVVFIIWIVQRRKSATSEEYQPAGMIYQPPAGGGGGGGVSGGGEGGSDASSIATMLTDFLKGISERQEAQSKEMREFLLAEAESQKAFMESQNKYIQDILDIVSKSKTNTPVVMPEIPEPPIKEQREIYYSPASSFKIPTGPVRVTDMPGATEDERWKQFEQTIAYDYLGSIVREAQTKVANLRAQWWSAKTPQEKAKLHQQAELERQRIYQEITRGGAGFTASWYDTGVGHKKLKITTPKGEVIDI